MPLPIIAQQRTCGTCTACCVTHSVYEFRKRTSVSCKHICASGCRIYEDRPQSCREFVCLWLKGSIQGDEALRPDKLGLVFEILPTKMASGLIAHLLCVYEVWPGSSREPAGQDLIDKLGRQYKLLIHDFDGRKRFWDGDPVPEMFLDQQDLWDTPNWEKLQTGELFSSLSG